MSEINVAVKPCRCGACQERTQQLLDWLASLIESINLVRLVNAREIEARADGVLDSIKRVESTAEAWRASSVSEARLSGAQMLDYVARSLRATLKGGES